MRSDSSPKNRKSRATERHRIERAIELYLRQCFRKPTVARVSELAEAAGTNRAHLSRVVTRALGEPPGRALRRRQLKYAEELLRTTDLPVADVASAAAFGTARTFFRAFLYEYGMTPGAYRLKSNQMSVDAPRRSSYRLRHS